MSTIPAEPPDTQQRVVTQADQPASVSLYTAGTVIALVTLLICTVLVALLPVAGDQTTYRWQPPTTFTYGKTQLMMPATPQRLVVELPCSAVQAVAPGPQALPVRLFSTGHSTAGEFSLWATQTSVTALLAGRPILGAELPIPAGECTFMAEYDDATRTVTLTEGARSQAVPLKTSMVYEEGASDQVQITGLATDRTLRTVIDVQVLSKPATQVWPIARWLILGAGLVAAMAMWWLAFRRSAPWRDPTPTPRWALSDTVVAVFSGALLFLVPPLSDDGWVLTTVRAFPELGYFSNFFTAEMAAQPAGFWWTTIERIWMTPLGTSIAALRLPSLLVLVLTWWFLRRRVLDQVVSPDRITWVRAAGASVYVALIAGWAPTLRPEPVVALLSVVAVALVVRFRRRPDTWVLYALAIVAALGFSVHQTGWIVLGAATAVLVDLRPWLRTHRRSGWLVLGYAAGLFVLLTLLLMMIKSNLAIVLAAQSAFVEGGRHNAVFDEALRIRMMLASAAPPVRLLAAVLVVVLPVGWLLLRKPVWSSPAARLAAGCASVGSLFLVLTSSKWMWHFGATVGLLTVAAALLVERSLTTRRGRFGLVTVTVLVGFVVAVRPSVWGLNDYRIVDASEPALGLGLRMLIFAAIAVAGWWLLRQDRPVRSAVVVLTAVSALLITASLGPLIRDGLADRRTSWPALVSQSLAGGCGLATAMQVPTVTRPLAEVPGQEALPDITVQDFAADSTVPVPPAPGTRIVRSATNLPAALVSPWYGTSSGQAMRTWLFAQPGEVVWSVDWINADGTPGTRDVSRIVGAPSYVLVPLDVPESATQVRVRWLSGQAPYLVTPVAVESTAPVATIARGTVARTPYNALLAPCFPQPDIATGAMSPFSWSLGLPMLGGSVVATGVSVFSEQACVASPEESKRGPLCWYSVQNPTADGLQRSTAVVSR